MIIAINIIHIINEYNIINDDTTINLLIKIRHQLSS